MSENSRSQSLDSAVRVALANGGNETPDEIVQRAEAFNNFLTNASNEDASPV